MTAFTLSSGRRCECYGVGLDKRLTKWLNTDYCKNSMVRKIEPIFFPGKWFVLSEQCQNNKPLARKSPRWDFTARGGVAQSKCSSIPTPCSIFIKPKTTKSSPILSLQPSTSALAVLSPTYPQIFCSNAGRIPLTCIPHHPPPECSSILNYSPHSSNLHFMKCRLPVLSFLRLYCQPPMWLQQRGFYHHENLPPRDQSLLERDLGPPAS